jgi:Ser/Thr protein kinase RdoA (MazF antagonist)
MTRTEIPLEVQEAYGLGSSGSGGSVVPLHSLINRTYLVQGDLGQGPRPMVLQRLHPVFGASVHVDIEAVTRHLQRHQLETPRLLRNRSGGLWTEAPSADGAAPHVWRASSYVEGATVHRSADPAQLRSAAELLGRFHGALLDLEHEFVHVRPLHDTPQHLTKLQGALASERGRADGEARELGEQILEHARGIRLDFSQFPRRVLHGDPKLSNVLFQRDQPAQARCMIDLDTLGRGFLAYELGDALRSWGNRAGEDQLEADFDPEVLRAVISGYALTCPSALQDEEICSAVAGLETVSLELASRFAADAVLDSYFGWDATRFPTRRAHNLVRARGQFSLARCVSRQAEVLLAIARQALSSRGPERC